MRTAAFYGCLLFAAWNAAAVEVPDLFTAELSAQSKDEKTRAGDFQRALLQVLGRVLRLEDQASVAKSFAEKPDRFIDSYEYLPENGTEGSGPLLKVEFDDQALKDSLRQRGIETFGPQRPEILVWLAIADEQGERLFDADQSPDVEKALADIANELGLPLAESLGDATDQEFLTAKDLPGIATEKVKTASARYETDVILLGRISRNAANAPWKGDWRLITGDSEGRWQGEGTLDAALRAGLSGAYGRLANTLVPPSVAPTSLDVRITGIASLEDSNDASNYLTGLSPVSKVEWSGLDGDAAAFKVKVRGGKALLDKSIAFGRHLKPATPGDSGGTTAVYQWTP